ncbi:MAG: ChbG/HpnK family deacetylase [Chloroflexi bacterium]|nr:ChbG/HpnK family deacetylase [Chloroflexota bacterium]MBU1751044.1 ChbG/HpnK family deacetylase [Chloroflexota bacterium]MBU1877736.1 ChbG/HpnK family deacetylase [Chloroflexota bacterium]
MRILIINGDDLGYSTGVNRAIAQCHEAGVLLSATALVNMPAWPQAAAYLREHPGLGAGVHLVFNDGRPVSPLMQVPTLVDDDGYFLEDEALLEHGDEVDVDELVQEWRAQIDRFVADTGRQPTHLDNHCAISYMCPEWFGAAIALAGELGLPMRMPFGDDLEERIGEMAASGGFSPDIARMMAGQYQALMAERGVRHPDRFLMDFSREGGRTAENLVRIIRGLREGVTELLAHPGYPAADAGSTSRRPASDQGWRQEETEALLDSHVRAAIEQTGVRLAHFGDAWE